MMHGLEKSDLAIVATKPANKAGRPTAERAEPRAGTKGNTGQPHTRRTQSRGSVSQGLDRVRHAARQRKKEKFTALLHHVTVECLTDAFLALKRRAAPGVDGVTWQDNEATYRSGVCLRAALSCCPARPKTPPNDSPRQPSPNLPGSGVAPKIRPLSWPGL